MKAAFLTSSLIASKGKAEPASTRLAPSNLLDKNANGSKPQVSRIYDRVREYAEPHHDSHDLEEAALRNAELSEFARIAEDEDRPEPSHIDEINTTDTTEEVAHGLAESLDEPVVSPQVPATPVNSTPAREFSPLAEEKAREIAQEVAKLKKDGLGRIRISVRMSPKDHLQLKLIAAHTQMSAQSIFETALEEYVINHGSEILPQSCNCVLDKSSL
ncbi:hypothetical protein [uncultured Sneathiella sp.]|jgi:hypothetical protein|uniref:hypothetical protein n=1 Tax=uncultured Sneathiella sp. TaxID=879315 RepID=UPI0030D7F964|tara:strand:+ start:1902 stop:2549 length:648 start_codon:yes stop_codon:yes gene_type:complete